MFHGIEPAATYFSPLAWTSYILICRRRDFRDLRRVPVCAREPRGLLKMAALSIPLWLIFEAYNLRLANWTYVGLPQGHLERWIGYAWAFATITPGIFMTAALIESFGWFSGGIDAPLRFGRAGRNRQHSSWRGAVADLPLLVPASSVRLFVRPGVARLSVSAGADQLSPALAVVRGRSRAGIARAAVFVSRRRLGLRMAVGILELLGARRMDLHFPDRPAMEDLPDARARISCVSGVCARMFRDVCERRVAVQP